MHKSSLLRIEWFVQNYLPAHDKVRILDVAICGVDAANVFGDRRFEYVGLDIEPGPNVDLVPALPYSWKEIDDDSFDMVIFGQALEHSEFFWLTLSEMARVLKKDGILCIIAPNGFAEHRFPVDCWRFFTDRMIALARSVNLEVLHAHTNSAPSKSHKEWYSATQADAMLVAIKPYAGTPILVDMARYKCAPVDQRDVRQGMVPYAGHIASNNIVHRIYRQIGRSIGAI